VFRPAAAAAIGIPVRNVSKLAQRGLITVKRPPVGRTQYLLADCERLAQQIVKKATA
jgi:hypothetical protein